MLLGAWEGHHRSLAKAISWRVAGSIDTLILSYLVTRSLAIASSIAGVETVTKIVLYYVHERAWTIVPWGKGSRADGEPSPIERWSARVGTLAEDMRGRLHHSLHPARIGAVAALVFCSIIVLAPSHLRLGQSGVPARSGAAVENAMGKAELRLRTADVLDGTAAPSRSVPVSEPANSGPQAAETAPVAEVAWQPANQEAALEPARQEPAAETPRPSLLDHDRAKEVQQRLNQLGYLSVSATGMWGALSRKALKAFKADHDLPADEAWDEATERTLFSGTVENTHPFVGIWGVDASACSPRLNRAGLLPAVIDAEGAWAGETFCAFQSKKRTARGWDMVASCANSQDRWTANVHLMIVGEQLIWTSERGSQSYQRCQPGLGVARAF